MATKVGTSVTATSSGSATTIASATKSTTTGNMLVAFLKWENTATPTLSSLTDTAGNTWVIDQQRAHTTGGEPHGAIAYALNITGNAANVVTATFSSAATFRVIIVSEFSGIALTSAVNGTSTNNVGTVAPYSTGAITTTQSGLVVGFIADFNALVTPVAQGTPTFTLDASVSDSFSIFLLSGSGQTITPGATVSSGTSRWVMLATAFKDNLSADTLMGQICL